MKFLIAKNFSLDLCCLNVFLAILILKKMHEIKGYSLYKVNKRGEIFRCKAKSFAKLSTYMVAGYHAVTLSQNGKRKIKHLHRILAETFIPNPKNKPCVNHIDGNKLNNNLSNLEWVTHKENIQHAWRTGLFSAKSEGGRSFLKDEQVKFIRENRNKFSQKELASILNINPLIVHNVVNNKFYCELPKPNNPIVFRERSKMLFDDKTGVFYYSINEYAELNGISQATARNRILHNKKDRIDLKYV
ncbi:HNH endonuclease [Sphingobacterium sp.]|uniref:HNH endonuclease n=1 Tax=Sphingobacterium sp. TaxID=341027 RepID=UPI0028AD51D1|nr:HNH endonuclease [Sphingobacterium sp.]